MLLYLAFWAPIALGYAFALAASGVLSWSRALVAGIYSAAPAALLGAAVVALCTRVSGNRLRLHWFAALHAAAAALFSAAWSTAILGELALLRTSGAASSFVRDGLAWQFVTGMIVYAVLAASTYVRIAQEREQKQQRVIERSETLRLHAELATLRARLHPHFLFNVLQTLSALVESRPRDAQRAIEYLAALLDRRLKDAAADSLVSFDDELRDVRDYIALESLRFGSRLRVEEHVDPGTTELLWPRFAFQPLVENAIRHGIAPRPSGGCVTITSRIEESVWHVEVRDDGVGTSQPPDAAGMGTLLVRERLRLHFGDRASMRVRSANDAGYDVAICIPLDAASPSNEADDE